MSRPTIVSVAMLAIGVVFGVGASVLGQKAADRRAEPGRYTANTMWVQSPLAGIGGFLIVTEITDHQTNTLYQYARVVPIGGGEPEDVVPKLEATIDLTSAGQPKLKMTYTKPPKKDEPKKDK